MTEKAASIYDKKQNVIEVLKEALANDGYVVFPLSPQMVKIWLRSVSEKDVVKKKLSKKDIVYYSLLSFMNINSFVSLRAELYKGHLGTLKPEITALEDGGYLVKVDMKKFINLPGVNPMGEIQEILDFHLWYKNVLVENPNSDIYVRLFNNRDNTRKVYATTNVTIHRTLRDDGTEDPDSMLSLKLNNELEEFLKTKSSLNDFFRNCALDLGHLGPWSTASTRDETVFNKYSTPFMESFHKHLQKIKSKD